jgi:hypothetical protein
MLTSTSAAATLSLFLPQAPPDKRLPRTGSGVVGLFHNDDYARAASAMLAAKMGSGQAQHIAQAIGEVEARLDIDHYGITIDPENYPHHVLRW